MSVVSREYPLSGTKRSYVSGLAFSLLAVTLILIATRPFPLTPASLFPASAAGTLPIAFTPNQGQADAEALFQAQGFGGSLRFSPRHVLWLLPTPAPGKTAARPSLQLQFQGTQASPGIIAGEQLPGVVHYLIGDDAASWIRNIPTYDSIVYEQLYPGIDLHYAGEQSVNGPWSLKGTYRVAPGADPHQIQWQYRGASSVRLDPATGNLHLSLSGHVNHALVETAPVSWQEIAGRRVPVESRYLLEADGSVRFALGTYDPAYPLLIDPTLTFSTYLGTSTEDVANSVAVDAQGHIYVGGWTDAVDFPTTPDALQPTSTGGTCFGPPPFNNPFPCNDGFVSKLSPDGGTLLYSTYFGGTGDDGVQAIALDQSGNVYLTGWTTSIDFPTVNPIQPGNGGGGNRTPDAFVARLVADGSALQYSTYLGGSGRDYGDNLAVDGQGGAYIVGWTESTDFPTVNPVQATYGGGFFDGIITKVNAAGDAFAYSSYLGGNDLDYAFGIDVDGDGSAHVTGFTLSDDFPTFNALQPTFGGGVEAYVTKLTPGGDDYAYSTYFGSDDTRGYDIRVGDSGHVYLVGATSSPDFPTLNPIQDTYSGVPLDAFVSRFLPDGSALDFSTYLGGNGNDVIHTLALDPDGNVHIVGWSTATDFPLNDPIQATPGGSTDVILGTITADLTTLAFSTYFGGSQNDLGFAIAVDDAGHAHIAGYTTSADFPTLNPLQPDAAGATDSFIARVALEDLPDPLWRLNLAYWMNDGSSGVGQLRLFANGRFLDQDGASGFWASPSPERLWLVYAPGAACEAVLIGSRVATSRWQGYRRCRDGSGTTGVWIGILLP